MRVVFLPNNILQEVAAGSNLLDAISSAGIVLDGSCRGMGRCGCCRVQIVSGDAGQPDGAEQKIFTDAELAEGWRLACRVTVSQSLRVLLPTLTNADHRKTGLVFIPEDFRPEGTETGLGVAFDIGTTTVVGMVWQLATGRLIDIEAMTNPQSVYGADVISRINFCGEAAGNLQVLQRKVVDCCNTLLATMAARSNFAPAAIHRAVAVGNTTMSHLFLGAEPSTLAESPFAPAFRGPQERLSGQLGLALAGDGVVRVLPNIAGHVGSDIVAGLLTCRLPERPGTNLFLDMGTNGEVVFRDENCFLACSTAAGPAFEGAAIFQGMRAADGAIEGVEIGEEQLILQVIGGGKPRGICGSGLIDGIACMLELGVIDRGGRLLDAAAAAKRQLPAWIQQRLTRRDGMPVFLLWQGEAGEEVVITQKDVREVQLGKGAIASGVNILLQVAGKTAAQLDHIYLAGAFGNYIRKESALAMGLLPEIGVEKIVSVGNAAGAGASMALLSQTEREKLLLQIQEVRHVELAQYPGFQEEFMRSMGFPQVRNQ